MFGIEDMMTQGDPDDAAKLRHIENSDFRYRNEVIAYQEVSFSIVSRLSREKGKT